MRKSFGYGRAGRFYSEESTCKVLEVLFEPLDVGVVAFKGGKFTDQSSNSWQALSWEVGADPFGHFVLTAAIEGVRNFLNNFAHVGKRSIELASSEVVIKFFKG